MDNETKLEQYADIQPFVQKEIASQFEALYKQYATKYGVASVPLHRHNGADAPTIGDASINNFKALPATTGGVLSPALLDEQVVYNTETEQLNSPAQVFVMPLQIVNGFGTAHDPNADFHGGDAPLGSMICFVNQSGDAAQLFIRLDRDTLTEKWWGVDLTVTEYP